MGLGSMIIDPATRVIVLRDSQNTHWKAEEMDLAEAAYQYKKELNESFPSKEVTQGLIDSLRWWGRFAFKRGKERLLIVTLGERLL